MTDSVYFDPALGGNGKTITNDSNPTTGLDNDGHRRDDGSGFVGALGQVVVMAQTAVTGASNAAASASTASTAAATATTKAGEASSSASTAAASALSASDDADAVAAGLALIAGGPVVSINGKTGIATLNASEIPFSPTGNIVATNTQAAVAELDTEKAKLSGGNTFSGTQTLSDGQLVQAMLKDVGAVYFDKGAVTSGTVTFAYTDGSHQRLQVGGVLTIAANTWPPAGNNGTLLLELVNGGAFAITWPTINWIKSDGTTTTTFSNLGITLQASGTDFILLWTRDAGTTIYGKVVR